MVVPKRRGFRVSLSPLILYYIYIYFISPSIFLPIFSAASVFTFICSGQDVLKAKTNCKDISIAGDRPGGYNNVILYQSVDDT